MAQILQGSTYTRSFLMVSNADHLTGATGMLTNVFIAKGGTQPLTVAAGTVGQTPGGSGLYYVILTPADTNTLGDLAYYCGATNCDATNFVDQITAWNPSSNSFVAGTTAQPVQLLAGTYAVNLSGSVNNIIQSIVAGTIAQNPLLVSGGTIGSVVGNVNIASQQIYVKKNAILNGFMFLMLSSTDHVTPKTGLTITSQVSINGGAFNPTANSASEISNGIYTINLAAADTNGNTLMFLFTGSGADNRYVEIVTQT